MRTPLDPPLDNKREGQQEDSWPRPPSADWPSAEAIKGPSPHAVDKAAEPLTFRTELLRIPMEDDPRRTADQLAVLRSAVTSIVRATVDLCQERDASAKTESSDKQRALHLEAFRRAFPSHLLSEVCSRGSKVGLDLSQIAGAVRDFSLYYERGPWSDGSTPLSPPMLNKICSIIQSTLYPIMPVEADTFLQHIEQGFETLNVGKTDGALELGMRLAWGYLVTQPGILEGQGASSAGGKLLDPKVVHLLATIPLNRSVTQTRSGGHLRRFQRILNSVSVGSEPQPLTRDAVRVFSEIFTKTCLTQPFYEGNHRTGWVVANDWLLKAHGHYIPFNSALEKGFKEISNYQGTDGGWMPEFVENFLVGRHQRKIPATFAEMLHGEVRSVKDLPGMGMRGSKDR